MPKYLIALGALLLATSTAIADDGAEEPLQVHGFVGQGALLTSDNNFLAKTERGSLEFTEIGINFTKRLDSRLTAGVQLFARDLGPEGNYSAKFDWFYLDYHWKDELGVRAGRVKIPFGLYNDSSDVDAAQPVILLPQSVYPSVDRDFLLAQTGFEAYGYRALGAAGALDYRAYFGTIFLQPTATPGVTLGNIDVPYITGGRVLWETPLEGLRVGASALAGELRGDLTFTGMPALGFRSKGVQGLGSVEYAKDGFLLAAEYERARSTTDIMGTPETKTSSDHGYGLAGYRWNPWLQTTAYYSLLYPDVDHRSGREHHQHDVAMAVRFDITPHWLFKLEAHLMRGTAALSPALNDNTPTSELVNQWVLLAAKTTVYF